MKTRISIRSTLSNGTQRTSPARRLLTNEGLMMVEKAPARGSGGLGVLGLSD